MATLMVPAQAQDSACPSRFRAPDETRRNPKCAACGKCEAVRRLALDLAFDRAAAESYSRNQAMRTAVQAAA